MKKLIPMFLCILLLAGCAETYDGPTVEKPVLAEHYSTHYYNFFGWDEQRSTSRMVFAYDIYGNQVRRQDYQENELTSVIHMRYDDRGNEISSVYWDHTGWIPYIERRTERTYDDQNRLTAYINYDMWGRETGRSTYTYDDDAHTQTWSNSDGDWVTSYYDEEGLKLREISNDGYETVYEYDDRGNRIGWTSTKDGVFFDRYESGFDAQNRMIWGRRLDAAGNIQSETVYAYDDDARTMTTTKNGGGWRIEYYTEDGRISLIEDYNEDATLTMYQQYTYRDIRVPAEREE